MSRVMAESVRCSRLLRTGVGFGLLGGFAAILDLVFAGCIATGPCQPVPPVPIILPLLVLVAGVALILLAFVRRRNKVG